MSKLRELRENPRKKDDIYRILIVEPNWLGDVVFTTPAIRAIRRAFPQAYISCWVVPRVADVLKYNPNIDELIIYDERKWYQAPGPALKFVLRLYNRFFDLGILFHRSFTRALMLRLAQVAVVVGQHTPKRRMLGLDMLVDVDYDSMHRIEFYLKIISEIGIEPAGYHYDFVVREEDRKYIYEMLNFWGVQKNYAVLIPGGNWAFKRWPEENYSLLADRIVKELGYDVLLVGSGRDLFLCESIADRCEYKDRIFVCAGKTTIGQLGALLSSARVVVANDTGPLHIASAVNRKVIGLYGPTSPYITGLYGDLARNNIFLNQKCKVPCYLEECVDDLRCMKEIGVDLVMEKVVEVVRDQW